MKPLHIIGAGGHGRVVFDVVSLCEPDRAVVWHDEAWETLIPTAPVGSVASVGELLKADPPELCVVAIGDGAKRLDMIRRLVANRHEIVSLRHPDAFVSPFARIGRGCVCMAGSVVQTGAVLGDGVIVNTAASVDHDCRLADGVHVAPGAHLAGDVQVGLRSWVGIGAAVREGITVGADVIVGAGAVVIRDVPDGTTVVGNPARRVDSAVR